MSGPLPLRGGAPAPPPIVSERPSSWPGRAADPDALAYFLDRAAEQGAAEALRAVRAGRRRVIGLCCTVIPDEIILALNAVPVRLCGGTPPAGTGDLPRDTCPVVRAALEAVEHGPLAELLDAAVLPTTCDWKVQAAGRLATRLPVVHVEVPRGRRPDALAGELRRLATELEEVTDSSLTTGSLRRALALTARARAAHRRIEALRKLPLPPLSGCEAMLIADTYGYGDLEGWTQACEELAESLEGAAYAVPGPRRPRLLLHGSPILWPNFKVPELVEISGGVVVGDDFCSRASRLAAPEVPPGSLRDMLAGLAARAVEPCTCGVVATASTRIEALLRQVRELDVDGVICHYLRGCTPTAAGQPGVLAALREAGVPALAIETDAGLEDVEGLRTRIEAFIELLMSRR